MFIIILAVQRKDRNKLQLRFDKTDRKLGKTLDEKFIVGTVLIDICKVFYCIPRKVLIAYLNARDLIQKTLMFVYSCRKPNVKVNEVLTFLPHSKLALKDHSSKFCKKASINSSAICSLQNIWLRKENKL